MVNWNKIKQIDKSNDTEIKNGIFDWKLSWHNEFYPHPWVYFGGFSSKFTEGDIAIVFEQYGCVEKVDLQIDEEKNESKGFGFVRYEDFFSTILAVDNLNGVVINGRTINVDHKKDYRPNRKHLEQEAKKEAEAVEEAKAIEMAMTPAEVEEKRLKKEKKELKKAKKAEKKGEKEERRKRKRLAAEGEANKRYKASVSALLEEERKKRLEEMRAAGELEDEAEESAPSWLGKANPSVKPAGFRKQGAGRKDDRDLYRR